MDLHVCYKKICKKIINDCKKHEKSYVLTKYDFVKNYIGTDNYINLVNDAHTMYNYNPNIINKNNVLSLKSKYLVQDGGIACALLEHANNLVDLIIAGIINSIPSVEFQYTYLTEVVINYINESHVTIKNKAKPVFDLISKVNTYIMPTGIKDKIKNKIADSSNKFMTSMLNLIKNKIIIPINTYVQSDKFKTLVHNFINNYCKTQKGGGISDYLKKKTICFFRKNIREFLIGLIGAFILTFIDILKEKINSNNTNEHENLVKEIETHGSIPIPTNIWGDVSNYIKNLVLRSLNMFCKYLIVYTWSCIPLIANSLRKFCGEQNKYGSCDFDFPPGLIQGINTKLNITSNEIADMYSRSCRHIIVNV